MRGRAHVYAGARISADDIIPLRHQNGGAEEDLGRHALAGIDPGFPGRVQKGDILVAGHEFGCGSGREHAVWALRGSGIAAVVPFAMEILEAGGLLPYVLRQTTGASSA